MFRIIRLSSLIALFFLFAGTGCGKEEPSVQVRKSPASNKRVVSTKRAALTNKPPKSEAKPKIVQQETPPEPKKLTVEEVELKTQQALSAAQAFAQQKEQEYHEKVDKQLARFYEQLERFRTQAEQASQKAKMQVSKEFDSLSEKMTVTSKALRGVNSANEDSLGDLSKRLDLLLQQLQPKLTAGSGQAPKEVAANN